MSKDITSRIGTQVILNDKNNYDDIFIRTVFAALLATMQDRCRWVYRFDTGDVEFSIPFMPDFVGQDRFLNNLFLDDTPGRRVELNTDVVPRAILKYKGMTIKSANYANPYVRSPHITVKDGNKIQASSRNKALPVQLNFSLEAKFSSTGDTYTFVQEMIKIFWYWNFFNFDYAGMKVDAVFFYPDNTTTEKPQDIKIDSIDNYTASTELVVDTYLPILTDTRSINEGRIRVFDLSIYDMKNSTKIIES